MQRNNALCCEIIIFMMIRILIRDHFQFTARLFPDGPIKCSAYIIDVMQGQKEKAIRPC
jgi:hypothetical protein